MGFRSRHRPPHHGFNGYVTFYVPGTTCATSCGRIMGSFHSTGGGAPVTNTTSAHVVVASCMDDLDWAAPLAAAGLTVLVLEKCSSGFDDTGTQVTQRVVAFTVQQGRQTRVMKRTGSVARGRPSTLLYEQVPNCGREALAYLYYITTRWATLRPVTLFLQGDAHSHLAAPILQQLPAIARDLQALQPSPRFVPLAGRLVPSTYSSGMPDMNLYCEVYQNLTGGALHGRSSAGDRRLKTSRCHIYSSLTHAHFAVSRDTIRRRSRQQYVDLLHLFESAGGMCVNTLQRWKELTATFLERTWALVFDCVRTLNGCPFLEGTSSSQLFKLCPAAARPLDSPSPNVTASLIKAWPEAGLGHVESQVKDQLQRNERMFHSLQRALHRLPSWSDPTSTLMRTGSRESLLFGMCL